MLVVAQRFADDLDGLLTRVHEELKGLPELAAELEIFTTNRYTAAAFYAKSAAVRSPRPKKILVITGAVFDGSTRGGELIAGFMEKVDVPVWMYSNEPYFCRGVTGRFNKYGGLNASERAGEPVLAKAIVEYFQDLAD